MAGRVFGADRRLLLRSRSAILASGRGAAPIAAKQSRIRPAWNVREVLVDGVGAAAGRRRRDVNQPVFGL